MAGDATTRPKCLIVVPRTRATVYRELASRFAERPDVEVRFDRRHGDRALSGVEVSAVGAGFLRADLRAEIEGTIRLLDP